MMLKNYSTVVPAGQSVMQVEQILCSFGASATMKEMAGDGRVIALSFKLNGRGYKIPVNVEGVRNVLYQGNRSSRLNSSKDRDERAYRVAWRIIKDWIHAQLSIIVSGQAQPDEVLLPYLFDGEKTLYQSYKKGILQIGTNPLSEGTVETDVIPPGEQE